MWALRANPLWAYECHDIGVLTKSRAGPSQPKPESLERPLPGVLGLVSA